MTDYKLTNLDREILKALVYGPLLLHESKIDGHIYSSYSYTIKMKSDEYHRCAINHMHQLVNEKYVIIDAKVWDGGSNVTGSITWKGLWALWLITHGKNRLTSKNASYNVCVKGTL